MATLLGRTQPLSFCHHTTLRSSSAAEVWGPRHPAPSGASPRARAAPGGRLRSHREIVSRRNLAPEPQPGTTPGRAH